MEGELLLLALYGNIIRSSNGVKTKIIEETQTAPVSMVALHAENMKLLEQVEETKEHFGISGAAKFDLNNRVAELGFDPMSPPPSFILFSNLSSCAFNL